MTDLRKTVLAKSDQLNADDLLGGGSLTIKITKVAATPDPDQPIAISFEGDGGKPYKPGKSMRRALINIWGPDGNAYVGRSLTLYRDEKVQFGGLAVGGIRISHASHINTTMTMALTATKGSKKAFTVKPLVATTDKAAELANAIVERVKAIATVEELQAITADADVVKQRKALGERRPELAERVDNAVAGALAALEQPATGDDK